ncbi:MAG TPA: hypothetical protein VML54_10560 [Candidatus Limnocylindrales bacterium]|nr:hypothetical protein [Candidatus Limnocylindrales bacterium]
MITRPARGRVALALLVLGTLVLVAGPAAAQPRNPMMIRQQIENSLSLQREAMASIGQPERAVKLVWDAYVSMRAAHGAMVINASSAKYPDPIFPLTDRRVEQARAHILAARDALRDPAKWSGSGNAIDIARENLSAAMRLTQIILATTF